MADLTYCPVCGQQRLIKKDIGGRKRQFCENCGYVHYVNPVPAVGILIEMEGGVVLIRRGQPPHKGEWTLPSGFIEADENAEDAAIREAEEETGLKVEIIELAGINSFPEGPPTSGIILFYRARPLGGNLHGGDDAIDARVFLPQDMPLLPFRTHREVMAEWLARFAPAHPAPPEEHPTHEDDTFIIRPAEARDLDEIQALLATIPANYDLTADQWREIALRFRESAGFEVFVAESMQSPPIILGFVTLSLVRTLMGGRGYINDMAVLPSYQRQGVGAALLEAVVRRADRLGLRALTVDASRANERARAFFMSSGFSTSERMEIKMR
jgi:ADP-ribose pyrophosphatase YjhB (NUDIX family)